MTDDNDDGNDGTPGSDGDADPGDGRSAAPETGGWDRRTLVRVLIGLAFGIPILVELLTFLGLIDARLFGGDGDDGEEPTTTATTTTPERRVGVGDELLPETVPTETLVDAYVVAGEWTVVLQVEVENTGDVPYEFNLTGVGTEAGSRVAMNASTDRIDPGGTASVTGRAAIPQGEKPASVRVVAVTFGEEGPRSVARDVALSRVPLRDA